ncbi:hypothetical protein [Xanthomonas fragariae]|uniref:hypothetical protein n=1 Tax=Xanthomonas fragariae TaxID=48664 RepID=UPI0022AA778F|nr:hypothetical protein [Xanthomonas fragariae]WAT15755.1 hypothetical protein OZ429_05070 [Xanthomonas fragariae]
MSGLEGISRGTSIQNLVTGGFKDSIDSGIGGMTQARQQNQFQSDLSGTVSQQIQNNNFITEEMNKLNLNMAYNQVAKKMGENAKSLTQG